MFGLVSWLIADDIGDWDDSDTVSCVGTFLWKQCVPVCFALYFAHVHLYLKMEITWCIFLSFFARLPLVVFILMKQMFCCVRYYLRVTVVRWLSDIVKELPLAVRTMSPYLNTNCSIKMDVGIEDALHIEFEYNKSRFHCVFVLTDCFDQCRHCVHLCSCQWC